MSISDSVFEDTNKGMSLDRFVYRDQSTCLIANYVARLGCLTQFGGRKRPNDVVAASLVGLLRHTEKQGESAGTCKDKTF